MRISNRSLLAAAIAASAMAFSSVLSAAPQWCLGTVDRVWVDHVGNVFTHPSWRNDHIRICNLRGNDTQTDTVTCSTWYSLLSQAVAENRPTTIYYVDIPSCAQIPTYTNAPIPYYVMMYRQ